MMNIGVIIQARTTSTRLPGKVLKYLPFNSGVTVLGQVIRRCQQSEYLNNVIVATTVDSMDDNIVKIAVEENVNWFRGSRDNVLERYYEAAVEYDLDVIVRVTSDCPCIDPGIIDKIIRNHFMLNADYTSNSLIRSYPHGLDVEVFNFSSLEKAYQMAEHPFEREHVTPFIYKSKPEYFRLNSFEAMEECRAPDIRVTLDTVEDYALLCAVYDYLYPVNNFFNVTDIVTLFKQKPWLKLVNGNIRQKNFDLTVDEEIKLAMEYCKLQELHRVSRFLDSLIK